MDEVIERELPSGVMDEEKKQFLGLNGTKRPIQKSELDGNYRHYVDFGNVENLISFLNERYGDKGFNYALQDFIGRIVC